MVASYASVAVAGGPTSISWCWLLARGLGSSVHGALIGLLEDFSQHDGYIVDTRCSDEVVRGESHRDLWCLELFSASPVNNILPLKFLAKAAYFNLGCS